MKIEFGMSVLSKRESLLGLEIAQHNGVSVEDEHLCEESLVEIRLGFIFFIFTIVFAKRGDKIETPDKVMKAMKAFEDELNNSENNQCK